MVSSGKSRRQRDYRAEEARRNERARALGFTSRAHMRRALRQGWSPVRATGSARSMIVGANEPAPPPLSVEPLRRESQEWSDRHSRVPTSRYHPEWDSGTVRTYHRAFINNETKASRIENGFAALRAFLVGDRGYYTDQEFDERYGADAYTRGR